ncbi:MAG: 50S ribosomal protein L4 [Candidatus Magasanikbacteria bacterium]
MKTKVYNLEGQAIGDIELSDKVFGVKVKNSVVHQVFVQQTNNQREPWADTKSKAEVSGGGKKPWKQKGTGRARHGSIRSPIWKGGGVIFGPRTDRNYDTKINKKVRRLAIKMCLTDKAANENLVVVDDFDFSAPKTKLFASALAKMPLRKTYLVLTDGKNEGIIKMTANISQVRTVRAEDINVMDMLNSTAILTNRAGVKKLEEVFGK